MPTLKRTQPTQRRAQETIDRILDTSAQLLETTAYYELSTNQIAERAHVSIGTVYRYFGDKGDIITALQARSERDIMHRLINGLAAASTMESTAGVRHVLTTLVDALERHRGVITAIVNDLPMGIQSNVLPGIEQQLYHIARLAVMQRYPRLPAQDAEEMLYLGMGVMLHAALRIVVGRPPHLDRESLINRVAAVVSGVSLPVAEAASVHPTR
ncbi:MAG: TetR/AcrR family transcriptional regulator [Mycobacterium sp.]